MDPPPKRPRTEQAGKERPAGGTQEDGVASGSGTSAQASGAGKFARRLPPFNTFAHALPTPPRRATPHKKLRPLPAAPTLAHSDLPMGQQRARGPEVEHRTAKRSERSAEHGNAVAGSSRLAAVESERAGAFTPIKRPRTMKAITSFGRPATPSAKAITSHTPALKPLTSFAPPRSVSKLGNASKRSLETPLRPGPVSLAQDGSPRKPPITTPISAQASRLFDSIPTRTAKVETGTTRLTDMIPAAPVPGSDWDGQGEDGTAESWSPKKRKGGYTVTGLASRASVTISSARTEQALWIHTIGRQIDKTSPLALPLLAKALQPSIRLLVIELLSTPPETHRHWEESKIALVKCRMLLSEAETAEFDEDGAVADVDLEGLVLLSLHSHPSSASLAHSRPLPLPHKRHKTPGNARTLLLPAMPHDLRLIEVGSEIWAWDPSYEVVLPSFDTTNFTPTISPPKGVAEGDEGDVFWDPRPPVELQREREEKTRKDEEGERVFKALMCSRFGVVL